MIPNTQNAQSSAFVVAWQAVLHICFTGTLMAAMYLYFIGYNWIVVGIAGLGILLLAMRTFAAKVCVRHNSYVALATWVLFDLAVGVHVLYGCFSSAVGYSARNFSGIGGWTLIFAVLYLYILFWRYPRDAATIWNAKKLNLASVYIITNLVAFCFLPPIASCALALLLD